MNSKIILLVLIFIVLVSGCINDGESQIREYSYNGELEGKYLEIKYGRGSAFSGRGYSYEFQNNGRLITKTTQGYIEEPKQEERQIERKKLENLVFQIQQTGFFELKDSYDCRKDKTLKYICGEDSEGITITLTIGEKTKTVYEYENSGPIELRHIENLIKDWNS